MPAALARRLRAGRLSSGWQNCKPPDNIERLNDQNVSFLSSWRLPCLLVDVDALSLTSHVHQLESRCLIDFLLAEILLKSAIENPNFRGTVSSIGRASDSSSLGCRFDTCTVHLIFPVLRNLTRAWASERNPELLVNGRNK